MAVGHSIRSLGLPIALFDDLVSAFGQDIMTTRYASWRDVLDYCRRSANPVGRLVLRIAGYRDDATGPIVGRAVHGVAVDEFLAGSRQGLARSDGCTCRPKPCAPLGASEETLRGERLTDGVGPAPSRSARR